MSRSSNGPTDVSEKLRRSRQRLLDLTLRNRLLNFRPGHPNYRDDLKAHLAHVVRDAVAYSPGDDLRLFDDLFDFEQADDASQVALHDQA